jgi:hypothetical protein
VNGTVFSFVHYIGIQIGANDINNNEVIEISAALEAAVFDIANDPSICATDVDHAKRSTFSTHLNANETIWDSEIVKRDGDSVIDNLDVPPCFLERMHAAFTEMAQNPGGALAQVIPGAMNGVEIGDLVGSVALAMQMAYAEFDQADFFNWVIISPYFVNENKI